MFENVGGKLQNIAAVVCILGIIASFIWGCILFKASVVLGFAVIIGGAIVSWINSIVIYAFGELVENVNYLSSNVESITRKLENSNEEKDNSPKESKYSYAAKMKANQPAGKIGTCGMCGSTDKPVVNVKITDDFGVRHRAVCPDCLKKYNCTLE